MHPLLLCNLSCFLSSQDIPYVMENDSTLWVPWWFGQWFSFLLLYNNFIPISLYITGAWGVGCRAWGAVRHGCGVGRGGSSGRGGRIGARGDPMPCDGFLDQS